MTNKLQVMVFISYLLMLWAMGCFIVWDQDVERFWARLGDLRWPPDYEWED